MDEESSHSLRLIRMLPLLLAASLILAPLVTAQLGEIAGQLNYAVQVGHNETLQLHLLNEGNSSIGVQVTPQRMQFSSNKTTQANQIIPAIAVSPENVTVPAYGTAAVNITISMPLSNKPNWATWEDILSAQEETNASNSGGALILEGVAKLVSVYAIPSTTTTTTIPTTVAQTSSGTSPGSSLLSGNALPIAVIVLIIIVAIAYYYTRAPKGKGKKAAAGKRAKKEEMEEEPESKESIRREIEELKRQKAKLQAEVKSAKKKGGGGKNPSSKKKASTKKKSSTRKRSTKTGARKRRSR